MSRPYDKPRTSTHFMFVFGGALFFTILVVAIVKGNKESSFAYLPGVGPGGMFMMPADAKYSDEHMLMQFERLLAERRINRGK